MAIKKSELYSSLWESCDKLRGAGGMDASQYKDYVLTMLFVKYVSDKYTGDVMSLIEVPKGASFDDMVALKGQPDIGDRINKEILRPLFASNGLEGSLEIVDFNDDEKLGSGKEKVELLSKLIAIFENPALNFKNNRAEDDDVLGDAYEFLMRHFATESGKSKGQFYTPAEVSRILSKVIDVHKANKPSYSAYDPTCGSGSLLLKVAGEAPNGLTLYGQEKDVATKGLAIMNMWLHGYPEASIAGKNTIASPQFTDDGKLKRFDFVVANPPFSIKNWDSGIVPLDDEYNRFRGYGVPPDKNGDYAFLLHIIASLKSTGKGAIILPHGVLFRGNAEAAIRQNIIERKLIKGVIGLPANLFYGTGIPACIIVIDKEDTDSREGIFMMDASKGFIKDGNKNRLREQDIHQIVDVFNTLTEVEKYARFVSFDEISTNEYNLNIPRYIDTQEAEDIQDLNAHLNGGIPDIDIDGLQRFWEVYPTLKSHLFSRFRESATGNEQVAEQRSLSGAEVSQSRSYSKLNVAASDIKSAIYEHPEFTAYSDELALVFDSWKTKIYDDLQGINEHTAPKKLEKNISEALLHEYNGKPLVNPYAMYQHFMDYWNDMMKDDVYLLAEDGWVATTKRVLEKNSKGKEVDKGWTCDLIPKQLVVDNYLADEQQALNDLISTLETKQAEIVTYNEEHAGEEGLLADATNDKGTITKTTLTKYLKSIKGDKSEKEAYDLGNKLLTAFAKEATLKKQIKAAEKQLDLLTLKKFGELTEAEVRTLVVDKKWLHSIKSLLQAEIDSISQRLTGRIKELAERYENALPQLTEQANTAEEKVASHLEKMGLVWS